MNKASEVCHTLFTKFCVGLDLGFPRRSTFDLATQISHILHEGAILETYRELEFCLLAHCLQHVPETQDDEHCCSAG